MRHTMHARMSRSPKGQRPRELNLTSAIDVVFLLLIFFIVTSQVSMGEGILRYEPRGTGKDPQVVPRIQEPLRVQIASLGESGYRIEVTGAPAQPASFADLQKLLISLQDHPEIGRHGIYAPDNRIILSTTPDVRWQHVVNAYNAVLQAGYSDIAIAKATR